MDKIIETIKKSQNILILSHVDEDCDAVATSLAMQMMLKNEGKNVLYILSKPIEERLSFLSNDFVVYDVDKDYGDFDLIICLDAADEKRIGRRIKLFERAKITLSIDHHYTNTNYADLNLVNGDMSSTGEMVYDLFVKMGVDITREIAELLYCSIMSDTGCLKYSCATPKTVMTIAELMKKGIDHSYLSRQLFDSEKLDVVRVKGQIMNSVVGYFDNRVNVVVVPDKLLKEYGVSENDLGDIVNIPRSVKGTEIAVSVREVDNRIKVSFRSNGMYNVGEIAKNFSGGGHEMAAGAANFDKNIDEVVEEVIKVIGEVING